VAIALIERGEDTQLQLTRERRLTDEEQCEQAPGIHLGIRQQPQLFELIGCQQVGLVDYDHDARQGVEPCTAIHALVTHLPVALAVQTTVHSAAMLTDDLVRRIGAVGRP